VTGTPLRWLQYGSRELLQPGLRRLSRLTGAILADPAWVSIGLTHRCNCRCVHCDIWKLPAQQELSLDQWTTIIDSLASWLGPTRLYISGGEPLMRDDLVELVAVASRRGFLVGVVTNGMLLTRQRARDLLEAGLFSLDVSLDSLTPSVHDGIRGVNGACDQAVAALDTMISLGAGARTSVACVLSSANLDHVTELVRWVSGRELRGVSVQVLEENFEGPQKPGWYRDHPLWIHDVAAVEALTERLLGERAAGAPILNHPRQLKLLPSYYADPESMRGFPCLVGLVNLGIGPRGDVRVCHRLPPVGSALENPPRKLWRSQAAHTRREQIARCDRGCKILNCNFPPGPLTRARRLLAMRRKAHGG
jgi:MoaA/NifB/PqqE/SkfB family radical SAM enzyme